MAQIFADSPVDKVRDPETYGIIGAAMEFADRGITHQKEFAIPVAYRGRPLDAVYRADFVCFESVIVELKAVSELSESHTGQALNYLKATGLHRADVLNFGEDRLNYRRVVLNYQ
jgi:GxxExxY protein